MTLEQRRILDDTASSLASSHPGQRIMSRLPAEKRAKIEGIIKRFEKPFGDATKPTQEFFKYFMTSMEKVKQMGDYDPATNTIKLKKVEETDAS